MTPGEIVVPVDAERAQRSAMREFWSLCERATDRVFTDYRAFHRWSVTDGERFWRLFLEWADLAVEGDAEPALLGQGVETAEFFPGLRLNYTHNLLRGVAASTPDDDAIIAVTEGQAPRRLTRAELAARVANAVAGLGARGLSAGDRVAALARNDEHAIVAALASAGLGAAWSSLAPELGAEAIVRRFAPLGPKVLFASSGAHYQGRLLPAAALVCEVVSRLPTVEAVVLLDDEAPFALGNGPSDPGRRPAVVSLRELEEEGALLSPPAFAPFPFDQPLFVLFSSGTTGPPKCIVHGAGGTLLEHVKELRLHADLRARDVLFFQTSCGWMMWNWQLSALAAGATIVVYDGSPAHPDEGALWRLVEGCGVTAFGTSPAYLQLCRDAGFVPRERVGLARLRSVMTTGSILAPVLFDWFVAAVGSIPLHSISGGTDIIGCFALGNPLLPVRRGELQCVSLGYDVQALPVDGAPEGAGELVCASPFPSRPIGFLDDPQGTRFHAAYFAQNEGVWTHGDWISIGEHGGVRILGRSDGVMNVRGIRIGPAEIYDILARIPEIVQAAVVEQPAPRSPGGTRLVLLLVLQEGMTLERPFVLRVKKAIAENASRAHVPEVVAAVPALPATFNGKISERAIRDVLAGRTVVNREALRNPESLDTLAAREDLRA